MGVWGDRRRRTLPKRQVLLKALLVQAETLQKIHVLSAKQLKRLQLEEQLLKRMLVTARNALPPDSKVLEGEPRELREALESIVPFSVHPSRTARQQEAQASETNAAGDGTESDRQVPQQGHSAGHSAEYSKKSVGRKADGRQLEASTSGTGLSGLSDSGAEPAVRKRRKLQAGRELSDDEWEAVTTAAFARIADPEDPMGDLVYGQLLDEESQMEQSDAEEGEEEALLESLKPGLKRAAPSATRAPQSGRRAPGRPPLPPKSRGARGGASGGRGSQKAAKAQSLESSDSDEEELGSSTVETGPPRRNPQRTVKQTRWRELDDFLSDDSDKEPGFKGLPLELDAPWEVLSRQAAAVLAGARAAGRQAVADPLIQQPASSQPEARPSPRVKGPARSQAIAAE